MSNGQVLAYLRVSSTGQNLDRQETITEGADRVFREKASAKTRDRPVLAELLGYAREGDTVRVWSIDRLGRNLRDLLAIVEELTAKGVTVQFEKDNLTYSPDSDTRPMDRLMFHMLSIFAEFERSLIDERRREGIAAAKAAGKRGHRAPALTPQQAEDACLRHAQGVPVARIAREAGVSRNTIYKALREAPGAVRLGATAVATEGETGFDGPAPRNSLL
ncbi:recombinase family protein [Micrococcus antarcticus]|uniref:recombinase family protein n=1 Tax=Micrococcus antarcticus TaxID=86171 RepID=UPI00384D156C